MKTFRIYEHPSAGAEAVKVGFSWPAAFFVVFWMLAKKLWLLSGIWILAYIVLIPVQDVALRSGSAVEVLIVVISHLALALLPAVKGNEWRERNLTRRGFDLAASVSADTPRAAIAQAVNRPGAPP